MPSGVVVAVQGPAAEELAHYLGWRPEAVVLPLALLLLVAPLLVVPVLVRVVGLRRWWSEKAVRLSN